MRPLRAPRWQTPRPCQRKGCKRTWLPSPALGHWARYLALLEAHPTIHGLFIDARRARGTANHHALSERYHAAVAACPVLREAREAWLGEVQAAWSREAA